MNMTYRIAFMIAFFCLLPLVTLASSKTKPLRKTSSFHQLVGKTAWRVSLKDFAVSTVKDGKVFTLRVQDNRYFSYTARLKNDSDAARIGPLQLPYASTLSGLLKSAWSFGAVDGVDFSLNIDWELYPESIRKWALVWRDSELREKWKNLPPREGYPHLVKMITRQLEEDFQPLAKDLGFEAAGASMEKMAFQEVDKLPFFQEVLKPAGVPANLELPMPLILSLHLKVAENAPIFPQQNPVEVAVDRLFATVKSSSDTLYGSFLRELNEYEISGDRKSSDETFTRLLPLSQKEFRTLAAQLLKACLQATGGEQAETFALRLDPVLYPKLYREMVTQFTFKPDLARKTPVCRPQLPERDFYVFEPSHASGFVQAVNPFLKVNGFELKRLLVSIDSSRKAASYPAYMERIKPLGIHPEDRPAVPDIVYMIVGKKQK